MLSNRLCQQVHNEMSSFLLCLVRGSDSDRCGDLITDWSFNCRSFEDHKREREKERAEGRPVEAVSVPPVKLIVCGAGRPSAAMQGRLATLPQQWTRYGMDLWRCVPWEAAAATMNNGLQNGHARHLADGHYVTLLFILVARCGAAFSSVRIAAKHDTSTAAFGVSCWFFWRRWSVDNTKHSNNVIEFDRTEMVPSMICENEESSWNVNEIFVNSHDILNKSKWGRSLLSGMIHGPFVDVLEMHFQLSSKLETKWSHSMKRFLLFLFSLRNEFSSILHSLYTMYQGYVTSQSTK